MMLTKDVHGELGNSSRQTQMQRRRRRRPYKLSMKKRPDELVITALLYDVVLNFCIGGIDVYLFVCCKLNLNASTSNAVHCVQRSP